MPLVTLLTDFGLRDTYVGQMKGAVLSVCPAATLVDLTHEVPAQDVEAGAFLLWSAVEAFPAGAIHLAVVDPGVGTRRRALAIATTRGDVLVGPDNGLLIPAAAKLGGWSAAVELNQPRFWRSPLSATFHGRDLFGPVAGHLAAGVPLAQLGREVTDVAQPIRFPEPVQEAGALQGQVLHVDGYGNVVTNIPGPLLPPHFSVHLRGQTAPSSNNYADAPPGDLLALVGSAGLLEIAVRDGNAAAALGVARGDVLTVKPR